MITKDVLIVGGGPAGSSCARRLQQHGIDCLILDQEVFPRQKPCAGWITPALFTTLGITPAEYPHGLTRFSSFQISLRGIKFKLPTKQYAIRRLEFDAWLLERSGVELLTHRVTRIEQQDNYFKIDEKYAANYIVGAGGTRCPVRRALFDDQDPPRKKALIIAKEEEFPYPIKDNRCHLWFFEGGLPGYAWYVPKTDGYLNVGLGGSAARLKARGETLNQHWDRLVERLAELGLVNNYAFKPLGYSYYLRQPSVEGRIGNAFLVGDSLGLATVDMGEGIGPAVQSGLLAADAIVHGQNYSTVTIPRYSFPSLLLLRK